jgi:D-alanine-D-alanine ligase
MTPTSLVPQEAQAIGMSYEQLCDKIIELSLEKYK